MLGKKKSGRDDKDDGAEKRKREEPRGGCRLQCPVLVIRYERVVLRPGGDGVIRGSIVKGDEAKPVAGGDLDQNGTFVVGKGTLGNGAVRSVGAVGEANGGAGRETEEVSCGGDGSGWESGVGDYVEEIDAVTGWPAWGPKK